MPRTGFFTVESNQRAEPKHSLINVGGGQYQALAVGLIDYLKRTSRINDDTLKKILERFYYHFPDYKSTQPYLTASERMNKIISGNRPSEVVSCMAYVLQQLMLDEIFANPLQYREFFAGLPATTTQTSLRQPNVELPVSALEAFSKVTGINLTLSIVEQEKELRRRVVFVGSPNALHSGIVLQENQETYHPHVKNKSDFHYVGHRATNLTKLTEKPCPEDLTISDMKAFIAEDDKRLLQTHHQWKNSLLTMLQLNEISVDDLFSMYTKYLPNKQSMVISPGQTFSLLKQSESQMLDTNDPADPHKVAKSMISALSQWISLGYVTPEQLFEQVENQPAAKSITA